MEIQPKVDLSKYKFADEAFWIFSPINNTLIQLMGMSEVIMPLMTKKFGGTFRNLAATLKGEYFISIAARMLGIQNDVNVIMLRWHNNRSRKYILAISVSYMPFVFLGALFVAFASALAPENYSIVLFSNVFVQIYFLIIVVLSFQIGVLMMKKYYADTLSAMNGLYLMLELFHPEGINTPSHRKRIQKRLKYLSHSIRLLAQQYKSDSTENERLIGAHFRAMEDYIHERERWVVLPKENTLEELRRDFSALLPILINGNYGEFVIPTKEFPEGEKPVPYWRRVASGILWFTGLVTPIFSLINIYILQSKTFLPEGTDPNTIGAIMGAWLLLTIDGILKLGIVETFINVVKSVRELR